VGSARWVLPAVAVGIGYIATLAVNRSLVEVRGASMEPTLWPGDRLLTVPPRRRWLVPGRVVVVADPADPSHLVVKRLARAEAGQVEVLGDHPAGSTDSRHWGPLPTAAVRRVVVRRWPDLRTRLHR
jgi:nickel-type superoxide dismutase maturation protease